MKTYLDCIPCLVRQSLDAVRFVTDDEPTHETVLREVLAAASGMRFHEPPAAMAQRVHRRIRELTGNADPYLEAKDRLNAIALELLPPLREELSAAADPFDLAVRLAIVGNLMDLGVRSALDEPHFHAAVESCRREPIDGDVGALRSRAAEARRILYLADNAGEIVFDRLLIEQMPPDRVTVVVKGGPVINDATLRDAEAAGLADLVEVIDNGSDAPGTILEDCSDAFRQRFQQADLIVAKGQANFETLSGCGRPVWLLLRVKCPVIGRHLGCAPGAMVARAPVSLGGRRAAS